jgi:hypothetical protein
VYLNHIKNGHTYFNHCYNLSGVAGGLRWTCTSIQISHVLYTFLAASASVLSFLLPVVTVSLGTLIKGIALRPQNCSMISSLVLELLFISQQVTCGICFESCPRGSMSAAACGHPFCSTCWRGMSVAA